jgi:hypothetical protein
MKPTLTEIKKAVRIAKSIMTESMKNELHSAQRLRGMTLNGMAGKREKKAMLIERSIKVLDSITTKDNQ